MKKFTNSYGSISVISLVLAAVFVSSSLLAVMQWYIYAASLRIVDGARYPNAGYCLLQVEFLVDSKSDKSSMKAGEKISVRYPLPMETPLKIGQSIMADISVTHGDNGIYYLLQPESVSIMEDNESFREIPLSLGDRLFSMPGLLVLMLFLAGGIVSYFFVMKPAKKAEAGSSLSDEQPRQNSSTDKDESE